MNECGNCKQKIIRKILMGILDVTQSELAEELNMSRGHISNMLTGRRDSEELNEYLYHRVFDKNLSTIN